MNANETAERGYTLVELTIAAALLAGAMAMIAISLSTASNSLHGDDLVAKGMESLQRSAVRVSQIMRPCSLTSYRVLSVASDVPVQASAVGEWIEPNDGEARAAIQFRAASGVESMNATALTLPRVLRLEPEATDPTDGVDNDGDGMIDEGYLVLDYDGVAVRLASNIERCVFTLTGRQVEIELHSAARRRNQAVQRFTAHETLYLRNN